MNCTSLVIQDLLQEEKEKQGQREVLGGVIEGSRLVGCTVKDRGGHTCLKCKGWRVLT
jgi:hypothetical protein